MWTIVTKVIPIIFIAVNIVEQIAALEGKLSSEQKKELALETIQKLVKELFGVELNETSMTVASTIIDSVVFLLNKTGWFSKPKQVPEEIIE